MKSLQQLLTEIQSASTNWATKVNVADMVAQQFGEEAVLHLVPLLESDDPDVRNAAALALREIGDNRALEPLIDAIQRPSNFSNRATLVYALERLDCSEYFPLIFSLVMSEKSDVRLSGLNILFEQGFFIDDDDVMKAKRLLSKCPLDHQLRIAILDRLSELG